MSDSDSKVCTNCRKRLPLSKFSKARGYKGGHRAQCKTCRNALQQAYVLRNPTVVKSPEYAAWHEMRKRCHSPSHARYGDYGGRGIAVCERWRHSFAAFYEDMGPRPGPRHSLDRIDNDGHYERSNCRWATKTQQQRNTRRNRLLTLDGKTMCVSAWSEHLGINVSTLYGRLHRGLPVEDVLAKH